MRAGTIHQELTPSIKTKISYPTSIESRNHLKEEELALFLMCEKSVKLLLSQNWIRFARY